MCGAPLSEVLNLPAVNDTVKHPQHLTRYYQQRGAAASVSELHPSRPLITLINDRPRRLAAAALSVPISLRLLWRIKSWDRPSSIRLCELMCWSYTTSARRNATRRRTSSTSKLHHRSSEIQQRGWSIRHVWIKKTQPTRCLDRSFRFDFIAVSTLKAVYDDVGVCLQSMPCEIYSLIANGQWLALKKASEKFFTVLKKPAV